MLKAIYVLFFGLILATFVGVGIATFYPAPKEPETPLFLQRVKEAPFTEEERQEEARYLDAQKAFQQEFTRYSRNVSVGALVMAIVFLIPSILLAARIDVLSDGLLLGGVFTLTYGIIRGLMSEDAIYRFIVVTIGLVVAAGLGYLKFVRPKQAA